MPQEPADGVPRKASTEAVSAMNERPSEAAMIAIVAAMEEAHLLDRSTIGGSRLRERSGDRKS